MIKGRNKQAQEKLLSLFMEEVINTPLLNKRNHTGRLEEENKGRLQSTNLKYCFSSAYIPYIKHNLRNLLSITQVYVISNRRQIVFKYSYYFFRSLFLKSSLELVSIHFLEQL